MFSVFTQTDISRVSLSEDDPTETKEVPQEVPEDVIEEIPQELPQDIPEEPPEEADRDQAAEGEQHLSSLDSLDWELQDEGDGSLLMDSPGGQDDSCPQETPEEPGASAVAEGALTEQHCVELLGQLMKQRDEALSHSSQLQARVPQYIKRTSRRSGGLDSQVSSEEQQQMYQQNLEMLRDLKEQLVAKAQQGDRQVEELARQCQEKKKKVGLQRLVQRTACSPSQPVLDGPQVDAEWGAFLAQKKEAAVPELSRRLGGPAARAKVASILEEEQQQQEELVKERLRNIRLSTGIHRLQAGLRGWAEQRDPVQVQFEQLQARRLEQKKQAEKDKERSVKMQQKIRSSLEVGPRVGEAGARGGRG